MRVCVNDAWVSFFKQTAEEHEFGFVFSLLVSSEVERFCYGP